MTISEERKAAALKWFDGHHYGSSCAEQDNIRELLQPAPSDQEVEEAVAECKDLLNKNELVALMVARVYLETLIRAAQQPRREWRTIIEDFLVITKGRWRALPLDTPEKKLITKAEKALK